MLDLDAGKIVQTFREHDGAILSLSFARDGKILASADESGKIVVWNADAGQVLHRLPGHTRGTQHVALSPDGSRLASLGRDRLGRIWSLDDSRQLVELKLDGNSYPAFALAWSPDGKHLATGINRVRGSNSEYVALWTTDGKFEKEIPHLGRRQMGTKSLAFTPDSTGLLEVSRDGFYVNVVLFDLATGKERKVFFRENHTYHEAPSGACAIAP